MDKQQLRRTSPYNGSLTREQFLFYEMKTTAALMMEGLSDEEIQIRVIAENLYQNPTEKMLKNFAQVCIRRLHGLQDDTLVAAIASQPSDVAKQICLYAMMKQYRLVWDFMVTVIGEKYTQRDFRFSRADVNLFFLRLQEQDDNVASWSGSTIAKIEQVIMRILMETEYINNSKADHLNPVMIHPVLESAIRRNGDTIVLPAFNCFW